MMEVIDQDYLRRMLELPDGLERLDRWITSILEERDTARAIAAAVVRDAEPARRRIEGLVAALNHEVQVRRDQRIELQAENDAAFAELDDWRAGRGRALTDADAERVARVMYAEHMVPGGPDPNLRAFDELEERERQTLESLARDFIRALEGGAA